ncbi:MAG: hypothetical protein Q9216_001180 [Gyalolechia sp. 2 TL-2023]
MCIRYFLSDTFNITTSAIETLPVHLASQIWREVKKSQIDSLRVWKIFVSVFGKQLGKSLAYKRLVLRNPPSDLSECISHVVSPSFAWVTFLTLAHVSFSRTDVVQVARLTNLGRLSLGPFSNGDLGLDDNIIRAWSRAASEAKAFAKLRILVCRSHFDLTSQIFAYFQEFPALGLFCTNNTNDSAAIKNHSRESGNPKSSSAFGNQAEEYCWYLMKDEELRASALAAHASTWQKVYDNCFQDGVFHAAKSSKRLDGNGDSLPTLELALGTDHPDQCSMRVVDLENLRFFYRKARRANKSLPVIVQDRKRVLPDYGDSETPFPKRRVIRPSRQRAIIDLMGTFEQ